MVRLHLSHIMKLLTHAFVDLLSDRVVASMAAPVDKDIADDSIGVVLAVYKPMKAVEVSQVWR